MVEEIIKSLIISQAVNSADIFQTPARDGYSPLLKTEEFSAV